MYKLIALAILFASVVLAQGRVGTTPSLWAGFSINEPLAIEGQTTGIQISFTIVNDREAPIDANYGISGRAGEGHLSLRKSGPVAF